MNTPSILAFVLLTIYAAAADDCDPNPCVKGVCSMEGSSFKCTCDLGFGGKLCAEETCSRAPNCKSCPGDQLPCVKCHRLYGLSSDGTPPYCRPCNSFSNCNDCDNTTICTECSSTYMGPDLQNIATCSPCSAKCRSCKISGGGKCDVCIDSTDAVDGLCECAKYCSDCTKSGWSLCDPGKCEPGYGIIAGSKCGKCPDNCATCNGGRCTKCVSNKFKLDQSKGICVASGDL